MTKYLNKRAITHVLSLPETFTLLILVISFVVSFSLSEHFDMSYLISSSTEYVELGIITLVMALVIISGEIDLSVASTLALVACWTSYLHIHMQVPFALCVVIAPLMGGILGAFNGWVINRFNLPSLVVTLATLALYRGLAQISLGDGSLNIPENYTGIDFINIPGTEVPISLLIFIGFSIAFYVLLHHTVFGRRIYAIGTNSEAALYAGIKTKKMTLIIFTLSGFVAGIAAILMNSRLGIARFDHGQGLELDSITAVLIGGIAIQGGRGTILGTVMALVAIVVIKCGMIVANVSAEYQLTVIGGMLILSVVASRIISIFNK
jgi:rhamnose transport system permease protein